VRHEAAEVRRTAPRLSCRHGEESRRNARNKRDETGPVGCASCHLHCMSPACLPFAFHVRVIRTTVAVAAAATAAVSRWLCIPLSPFRCPFPRRCPLPSRFSPRPCSAFRCSLLNEKRVGGGEGGGGTIAVGGVRVHRAASRHA